MPSWHHELSKLGHAGRQGQPREEICGQGDHMASVTSLSHSSPPCVSPPPYSTCICCNILDPDVTTVYDARAVICNYLTLEVKELQFDQCGIYNINILAANRRLQ